MRDAVKDKTLTDLLITQNIPRCRSSEKEAEEQRATDILLCTEICELTSRKS